MSVDHKATDKEERARIQAIGGFVTEKVFTLELVHFAKVKY